VAMSFTSLIHNHRNGITSPTDLVNIMNTGNLLFAAVRKNSSKLTFSRSTEVLTVALATSELKACAGGILLRGIILHWQRCSLRVLV